MKYMIGQNRSQIALIPSSLDEAVELENEVRLIDLFVDSLDIRGMGFPMDQVENGRPSYHPADLLRLFLYGYLNRVRSSRSLERECKRNVEVIPYERDKLWLMKGLAPDHNTISNFRRDNSEAIREVFRSTVRVAKQFNLSGANVLPGDSTKLRARTVRRTTTISPKSTGT